MNKLQQIQATDELIEESFVAYTKGMKLPDYATIRHLINYTRSAPSERAGELIEEIRHKIQTLIPPKN